MQTNEPLAVDDFDPQNLDGIDLFDLTVTDVGDEAGAFAIIVEGFCNCLCECFPSECR